MVIFACIPIYIIIEYVCRGVYMKCFYHEERDAVATCKRCNKGLCKECASLYNPSFCGECAEIVEDEMVSSMKQERKSALIDTTSEFIFAIVKGVLAVIVGYFIMNAIYDGNVNFSQVWFFFFLPFGWAVFTYLEQFLPSVILGGLLFWFYLIFKFVISIFLGIPCFIYQVIKFVIGLISNRK